MTAVRIGLLGWGALGSEIGNALGRGEVSGARLTVVGVRDRSTVDIDGAVVVSPDELADHCDVIVEAATQDAVLRYLPDYLAVGRRVIVLSTGAFRDQKLFDRFIDHGTDRLIICSGAIGAVDLIRACRRVGVIHSVLLETTKPSPILVQPWMDDEMIASLTNGDQPVVCFAGPAILAAERFPKSVNVAATLALAVGGWDGVEVRVIGDPDATANVHCITIIADAGVYRIDVRNASLEANPRSSALVIGSVLRAVASLSTNEPQFL